MSRRVQSARKAQTVRFSGSRVLCNAGMEPPDIDRWARPDAAGLRLLEKAARTLGLSARAYHRVLRVARTVADLAGQEAVRAVHLAEAVAYRSLDRESGPRSAAVGQW